MPLYPAFPWVLGLKFRSLCTMLYPLPDVISFVVSYLLSLKTLCSNKREGNLLIFEFHDWKLAMGKSSVLGYFYKVDKVVSSLDTYLKDYILPWR